MQGTGLLRKVGRSGWCSQRRSQLPGAWLLVRGAPPDRYRMKGWGLGPIGFRVKGLGFRFRGFRGFRVKVRGIGVRVHGRVTTS